MNRLSLFLITLLSGGLITAAPINARAAGRPLVYVFFKEKFLSIDNFLSKKLDLHVDSCTYISNATKESSSFTTLGECVALNLNEGFSTKVAPGTMNVNLTNTVTKDHLSIQITWRPGLGGRLHIADRLYKEWTQEPDNEDKDGLLGDIKLKFPLGPLDDGAILLKSFGTVVQAIIAQGIHLSEIDVSTVADEWDTTYTETGVDFLEAGNTKPFYSIEVISNFNFLNKKKPVHIEARGQ